MVTISLLLLPTWIEYSDSYDCLPFLSCSGLMFTALAPAFRLRLEGILHYSSAAVCCVSAVLWMLLSGMFPFVLFWGFLSLMLYLQFGHYMWWIEIAVIGSLFSCLV